MPNDRKTIFLLISQKKRKEKISLEKITTAACLPLANPGLPMSARAPPPGAARYPLGAVLGRGTYGIVYACGALAVKELQRGGVTADTLPHLPEVAAHAALGGSSGGVVAALLDAEVVDGRARLVFERATENLYEALARARLRAPPAPPPPAAAAARAAAAQLRSLVAALAAVHAAGLVHRDVKPENCLLYGAGGGLRLADLGCARPAAPHRRPLTPYVSTLWYRAPEVLLRLPYGAPVDVFAAGCIAAEIFALAPLAPGSSEADQLRLLARALGAPPRDLVAAAAAGAAAGSAAAAAGALLLLGGAPLSVEQRAARLAHAMPGAPAAARDLVARMLAWRPQERPTAAECARHPFLAGGAEAGGGEEGGTGSAVGAPLQQQGTEATSAAAAAAAATLRLFDVRGLAGALSAAAGSAAAALKRRRPAAMTVRPVVPPPLPPPARPACAAAAAASPLPEAVLSPTLPPRRASLPAAAAQPPAGDAPDWQRAAAAAHAGLPPPRGYAGAHGGSRGVAASSFTPVTALRAPVPPLPPSPPLRLHPLSSRYAPISLLQAPAAAGAPSPAWRPPPPPPPGRALPWAPRR